MGYLWNYFCSYFFSIDVNDEKQRKFVLKICSNILSRYSYSNDYFGHNQFEVDILLKEVFQSNDIKVRRSNYTSSVDIDLNDKHIFEKVIPICEKWSQPNVGYLKRLDKQKRKEWSQTYNGYHPEERLKNDLICNIDNILPGFNYLIDFEWCAKDYQHYGVGDLVFGSDYGVYISIETKHLNMNSGKTAQVSRNNARNEVRYQAEKYKEFAKEKFMIKVIGASYTNDTERIRFVNDQDELIARIIAYYYENRVTWFTIIKRLFVISLCIIFLVIILSNKSQ